MSGTSGSEASLSVGVLYISSDWHAGSLWGGTFYFRRPLRMLLFVKCMILVKTKCNEEAQVSFSFILISERWGMWNGSLRAVTCVSDQDYWSSTWIIFCGSDGVKSVTCCRDAHLDALRTYTYMLTVASSSVNLVNMELFRYSLKKNTSSWTDDFKESRCTTKYAWCVQNSA